MTEQPLIHRKTGPPTPINAHDILAALVDTMRLHGIPVASRYKGMIAKQAKELLDDGFTADVILTAAVLSVRRGTPHELHHITQDIAVAQAGQHLSRRDYQHQLAAATRLLDPAEREHRQRLQRILGGANR